MRCTEGEAAPTDVVATRCLVESMVGVGLRSINRSWCVQVVENENTDLVDRRGPLVCGWMEAELRQGGRNGYCCLLDDYQSGYVYTRRCIIQNITTIVRL